MIRNTDQQLIEDHIFDCTIERMFELKQYSNNSNMLDTYMQQLESNNIDPQLEDEIGQIFTEQYNHISTIYNMPCKTNNMLQEAREKDSSGFSSKLSKKLKVVKRNYRTDRKLGTSKIRSAINASGLAASTKKMREDSRPYNQSKAVDRAKLTALYTRDKLNNEDYTRQPRKRYFPQSRSVGVIG